MQRRIRVWDMPTRLFHWLLVGAVGSAFVTGQLGGGWMVWHGRMGIFVVGLLAFRLAWGVLGSSYARFAQFFPTPAKVRAYLRGAWQGVGHNPLGALSVFGLLGVLAMQALTGLVANDDIAFRGPLYELAGRALSNRLTGLHHLTSNLLVGLVGLHIAAIVYYQRVKQKNLVTPMITGWQESAQGESATGGGWLALLVALAFSGLVLYGATGAWLPSPPPVVPAETPDW